MTDTLELEKTLWSAADKLRKEPRLPANIQHWVPMYP